jgi:hypothetical protein
VLRETEDEMSGAKAAYPPVDGGVEREAVISDEHYGRAVQQGCAAITPYLGTFQDEEEEEEEEDDRQGREAAYPAADQGDGITSALNLGRRLATRGDLPRAAAAHRRAAARRDTDVATMAREALLRLGAYVRPDVVDRAGSRPTPLDDANPADTLSTERADVAKAVGSSIEGEEHDHAEGGGTTPTIRSPVPQAVDSDTDRDGHARNTVGWFLRRRLLLGVALSVALAIAAVAEVTTDSQSSAPSRRATVPSEKKAARSVAGRVPRRPATIKPKSAATPRTDTARAAAESSPPATEVPVVTRNTKAASSGRTTGAGNRINAIYGGRGSTYHPSSGVDSRHTGSSNPSTSTGSPYTGSSEPIRTSGSPGSSTGSSGSHGRSPTDKSGGTTPSNAGTTPTDTGTSTDSGVISSGGG